MRSKKKLTVRDLMALDYLERESKRKKEAKEKAKREEKLFEVVEYVLSHDPDEAVDITYFCNSRGLYLTQSELNWIKREVRKR